MDKAYDLKVLVEKLKGRGLDLAEDAVVILIEELSEWTVESALISKGSLDDILAVVMPILKKEALKYADKIDGKDDLAQ